MQVHPIRILLAPPQVGEDVSSSEPPILGEGESHTVEFSPALPNQGAFFFRTYQHVYQDGPQGHQAGPSAKCGRGDALPSAALAGFRRRVGGQVTGSHLTHH